jgi:hypothetical protein
MPRPSPEELRRRRLIAVLIVFGVIAVVVIGGALVLGGGDSETTAGPTTSTTPPTSLPPTTLVPLKVTAIGDSVMLGAADELADAGVVVDATVSRQLRDTIEFVAQFHEHGQLGDTVIIHLGNNAAFTVSELDTLMDELNDVPDVIVLTLHTPKNWAAPNNRLLRDLPARHPNVQVVDWEQLATQCPGDCLYADRTHLTPHGQQYYTQLILDALHN